MATNVLITCEQMQDSLNEVLEAVDFEDVDFHQPKLESQAFTESEMMSLVQGMDFLIAGDDQITKKVIDCSTLKGVIKWGIGYDSIDVAYLKSRRIAFSNTPGQFAHDVAEQALAMLFAVERATALLDQEVRRGNWTKFRGQRIFGKTALVLGFGSIGKSLCGKLSALGIEVTAYDPLASRQTGDEGIVLLDTLPAGTNYDYLFLCFPLTHETRNSINAEYLMSVVEGGVVINVARGELIVENDLVRLLNEGEIRGAGLDVYSTEPLPAASKLKQMSNVVLGCHNASNTVNGVREASIAAGNKLHDWLSARTDDQ